MEDTKLDQRIYKFPLEVTDEQTVMLPDGSWVLSAQFQNGQLCLWARVSVGEPTSPWTVRIVGTGNAMPDTLGQHLDTVQQAGGLLVWHVFIQAPAVTS